MDGMLRKLDDLRVVLRTSAPAPRWGRGRVCCAPRRHPPPIPHQCLQREGLRVVGTCVFVDVSDPSVGASHGSHCGLCVCEGGDSEVEGEDQRVQHVAFGLGCVFPFVCLGLCDLCMCACACALQSSVFAIRGRLRDWAGGGRGLSCPAAPSAATTATAAAAASATGHSALQSDVTQHPCTARVSSCQPRAASAATAAVRAGAGCDGPRA
jgi:hypothetical protein